MDVELRPLFEHNGNNEGPQVAQLWAGSLCRKDPEKEVTTHCSILTWKKKKKISWTEEPGRLQPMVS